MAENNYNLDLIAQDLLYYGYCFNYFVDNYGGDLDRKTLKNIWEKQIKKMERL